MKKGFLFISLIIIFIMIILMIFNKGGNNNMSNTNFITSNNNPTINNINNTTPDDNNNTTTDIKEQSIENVKMEIKEGTLKKTGATIVIKDNNIKPYIYSEWFRIDKKVNNNWEKLNIINNKHSFSAVAYNIDNTGKFERTIEWSEIYGTLDKGYYKLIKNVYDNEGNEIYFSVEFEIVE